jgi:hypothetical protein
MESLYGIRLWSCSWWLEKWNVKGKEVIKVPEPRIVPSVLNRRHSTAPGPNKDKPRQRVIQQYSWLISLSQKEEVMRIYWARFFFSCLLGPLWHLIGLNCFWVYFVLSYFVWGAISCSLSLWRSRNAAFGLQNCSTRHSGPSVEAKTWLLRLFLTQMKARVLL